MADKLTQQLGDIIIAIENKLWLSETNDIGLQYTQADIKPVINHVRTKYRNITAIERTNMTKQIRASIEPLYKITSIGIFKAMNKLDYRDYASMDVVRDVLMLFTVERSITSEATTACNMIADVLFEIDNERPNYKNSLSYKYLRTFLLLVLVNDYADASCLATFVLSQIGG